MVRVIKNTSGTLVRSQFTWVMILDAQLSVWSHFASSEQQPHEICPASWNETLLHTTDGFYPIEYALSSSFPRIKCFSWINIQYFSSSVGYSRLRDFQIHSNKFLPEPSTDDRNWSQGETKNDFDSKQKVWAITNALRSFRVQRFAWKPSRFFWRVGTLPVTYSIDFYSLYSEIGSETVSKDSILTREKFGQLRLLW